MASRSAGSSRTPSARPPLTRDHIAAEALALVDEESLEGLSMRTLGKRLGVEAMALYYHFPNKGALLDAVAEQLLLELQFPKRGTPFARIRAGLRRYRQLAVDHPRAFVLLTTRRFSTERSLAVLEEILAPYAEAGFDPQMTARLFRLGGYFVGGAGHAEIASRGQQPDATPIVMEDESGVAPFPNVSRVAPHLALSRLDDIFEYGLDQLIRAMERAPRRAGGKRRADG